MTRHKSISQRLKTAKSMTLKKEIIHSWVSEWHKDQSCLIDKIKQASLNNNISESLFFLGCLAGESDKKFKALPNIIECIAGDSNEQTRHK